MARIYPPRHRVRFRCCRSLSPVTPFSARCRCLTASSLIPYIYGQFFSRYAIITWVAQWCTSWNSQPRSCVQTPGTKPSGIMCLLVCVITKVQAPRWVACQRLVLGSSICGCGSSNQEPPVHENSRHRGPFPLWQDVGWYCFLSHNWAKFRIPTCSFRVRRQRVVTLCNFLTNINMLESPNVTVPNVLVHLTILPPAQNHTASHKFLFPDWSVKHCWDSPCFYPPAH